MSYSGSTEGHDREKRYVHVRLTVTLKPVIFPIDFLELLEVLKKQGYEPVVELPSPSGGARLVGSGTIAKRGEISVAADSQRRFIGVDARSTGDAVSAFAEIVQAIRDGLWLDVRDQASYYEIIARMRVQGHANPAAAIGRFFQKLEGIGEIDSIIGEPVSLFTIRLIPKDKLPSDEEWFDIRIEPDMSLPETAYVIEAVYRKSTWSQVENFAETVESKIDAILDKLE